MDASLSNIYQTVSAITETYFSVAPRNKMNTFPLAILQPISEVPTQHLNGTDILKECTLTVSIYHLSYIAAKEIADSISLSLTELDQLWFDSEESSLDDEGQSSQSYVHRITQTYTFFTGAE